MDTFAQVIDAFGGPADFAREVGMPYQTAKRSRLRNTLAVRWFSPTATAARARGLKIDEATLCRLKAAA